MNALATTQKRFRWVLRRVLGAGILFLLMPGIAVARSSISAVGTGGEWPSNSLQ